MRISVIIPCRNEEGHIRQFLDSLRNQALEPGDEVEVLVADGLSDDGTREALRLYSEAHPAVRVIDNPGRIVSTGLNAAIAASTGDVIIRMDAHTVYATNYIRECVKTLQQSGADNVGGPWVANPSGAGPIGKAIAAAFRSRFCAGGGKAHDPGYEGEVDTVYLGCWPRSVFERVGLFDPDLVRNQDDEFNFRLRRSGGRIWQSPRIRSTYSPRASIRSLFRQYLQYGFWKVAVIRKHGAIASWRHLAPALFVGSLLTAPVLIAMLSLIGWPAAAAFVAGAFALELGIYLIAAIAAALPFARSLGTRGFLAMPVIIAVYHIAYGLGFLIGVGTQIRFGPGRPARGQLFTALTR